MSLTYFWIALFLVAAGMPIVFALLVGPGLSLLIDGESRFFTALLARLYNGMDSFPLMAIPLFILAGEVMNAGGITGAIVRFSSALIGHVRGGLAQVNILSSIIFAGMSGSAVADASALGKMLIPAMEKSGYPRRFAAAITASSSVIGPIIPPSGIMILYAYIMDVSIAGLFAAGLLPGLLVAAGLMVATFIIAKKRDFPVAKRAANWRHRVRATRAAGPALLTPFILLGGILGGIFTPTEAAAVAVGYALFVSLFMSRALGFAELPGVFVRAASQSGVILFLVGAAVVYAWIVTVSGVTQILGGWITALDVHPIILLLVLNVVLLLIGMFLDAGPAILLLGPVLGPIFADMGIDPLHFAMIMCTNLTIGLATPPIGLALFVTANVAEEKPEAIAAEMVPFLAVELVAVLIITYVPILSLGLPRALNLGG